MVLLLMLFPFVPGLHVYTCSASLIYSPYQRAEGLQGSSDLSTPFFPSWLYLHFLSIHLFHFLLVSRKSCTGGEGGGLPTSYQDALEVCVADTVEWYILCTRLHFFWFCWPTSLPEASTSVVLWSPTPSWKDSCITDILISVLESNTACRLVHTSQRQTFGAQTHSSLNGLLWAVPGGEKPWLTVL